MLPVAVALVAMGLCAPSLRLGWILDDDVLRAALVGPEQMPELARSPAQLFAWQGDSWPAHPDTTPWWVHPEFKVAFFRPLTGMTHWLDQRLWPEEAMWMHLQSVLWSGLMVLCAGVLFRRLAAPGKVWIAGLAALVFALDDARAVPAAWIANRNALLSLLFGLLALIAYDRWRRDGWRPGAFAAPGALLLAVLSSEAAVACGAYLLSYALFLDRGPMRRRLVALVPCAAVGFVYVLAYKAMGYGARASAAYVDIGQEPWRFLGTLLERGPISLWGQIGHPPPDLYTSLSQPAARQAWWVAVGMLVLSGLLLTPLLRRDSRARFWACGMLLALPPSCGMYPDSRLLGYVSLGAASLLAMFVAAAWRGGGGPRRGWRSTSWRWLARLLTLPLLFVHLVQDPRTVWSKAGALAGLNSFLTGVAATLPSDPEVRSQQAVIVNSPSFYLTYYASPHKVLRGHTIPRETLTLATSLHPIEVHRPSRQALTVRPLGGFLLPAGTVPPGRPLPANSFNHFLQEFDLVFRAPAPFRVGERIDRRRVRIEIDEVTEDGRPAAVSFLFDADLEDPSWRWLRWQNGGFTAWQPPAVGASVTLPPVW